MDNFMKNISHAFGIGLIIVAFSGCPLAATAREIADGGHDATLILGGGNFVKIVDTADMLDGDDYYPGVIWEYDVRDAASIMGIKRSKADHVDDCKPIDDNTKILITSSYHWTIIVDRDTRNIDFWTTASRNAHSAEVLPGNKIAVACSNPGDSIQIYDRSRPNEILFSIELPSAHGVVWNDKRQRLYANGKQRLNIYSLIFADTDTPKLILQKSIKTPQGGTHDLSDVDENTLIVSGQKAYFFDMNEETFTELKRFSDCTAIKSINYNPKNGECWFTDSTDPEGDYSWSTQTCRHTYDVQAQPDNDDFLFKTPDINLYKVRVLHWGSEQAGVEETATEIQADAPVEYYNLQGVRLSDPEPGVNICRRNGKVTKEFFKFH